MKDHNDGGLVHPGLKTYREARAKDREKYLLRKEILENNPDLVNHPNQLMSIINGAYNARNAQKEPSRTRGKRQIRRV